MRIAAARITLDYYNNSSLSKKRELLDGICADLKRKFPVSVAEVAEVEDPEKCVLGFCVVIPDHWKTVSIQNFLETICKHIDETSAARVVDEDTEILTFEGSDTPRTS